MIIIVIIMLFQRAIHVKYRPYQIPLILRMKVGRRSTTRMNEILFKKNGLLLDSSHIAQVEANLLSNQSSHHN
jgi:hypothetical protein